MKTCPICKAKVFEDMDVCYGCLHSFKENGANPSRPTFKESEPDGGRPSLGQGRAGRNQSVIKEDDASRRQVTAPLVPVNSMSVKTEPEGAVPLLAGDLPEGYRLVIRLEPV